MLKQITLIIFVLMGFRTEIAHSTSSELRLVITVNGDLLSINTRGERQRTLLSNGCWNQAQRLLADRRTLVFYAYGEDCMIQGINRLDLATGNVTPVSSIVIPNFVSPTISPDGTMLAGIRTASGYQQSAYGTHILYIWDLATDRERKVVDGIWNHFNYLNLLWSPDSRYFAYEAHDHKQTDRQPTWFIINLASDTTTSYVNLISPHWALDGLLFDDSTLIFPSTDRGIEMPSWSPNDQHIAYVSRTSYNEALDLTMNAVWIADSETGETWQVHPTTENGTNPEWSPDGTILAYTQHAYDVVFDSTLNSGTGANRPVNFRSMLHLVDGHQNTVIFESPCCNITRALC